MRVVLDASVAVKWLVSEADSVMATKLLDESYDLNAPRLLVAEVANTLWRKALSGSLDTHEAARMTTALQDMPLRWMDDEPTCLDALRIALELGHPASDCMYLALALRNGAKVVTSDNRFVSAVASTAYRPAVVLLRDFFGNGEDSLVHMRAL